MQESWRRIAGPFEQESPQANVKRILTRLLEELAIGRVALVKKGKISTLVDANTITNSELFDFEKESLRGLNVEGGLSQWTTTNLNAPLRYSDLSPQMDLHKLFAATRLGDENLELSLHVACHQSFRPPLDETEMQLIQWTGGRILGLLHQESEANLKQLARFDELVARISTQFVNIEPEEISSQIEQSLALLGQQTQVQRAYIFQLDNEKETLSNTYEWLETDIPSQKEDAQNLPQNEFSWWLNALKTLKPVRITSLDALPEEASIEHKILDKQGVKSLVLVPMVNKGKLAGFLGLSSTVSNRKWSDREIHLLRLVGDMMIQVLQKQRQHFELRNFERRVNALANTVFDAVVTINEAGYVLEWNDKAEEMFGYKVKEALGQRMSDLIVPDLYREAHERGMEKFRKTGEGPVLGSRIEIIAMNKQREVFPIELAITPIHLGDRYIFTGYLRDISYRKDAEQKREKLLLELEKANQELKDFAYIVSHDLKAPLRAIGSLTDWLYEDYKDQLDEDGQDQLELLKERVRRMYGLIEGILTYSRVGRTVENKEVVDFNVTLEDVKLGLEIPSNFEIILEGKLPILNWDSTRAFQVFQNLISNAIKYNDKEQAWIKISCKDERTHYRIDFEDNGKGIDPKYFRKIFQIFQTLQPRDEFESTGIGLTLVKKIVEMHGGRIDVKSTLGEGTTFSVKLSKEEK
ncbi:MAG: ATP-binding protein [Bacteroidia bacterium]